MNIFRITIFLYLGAVAHACIAAIDEITDMKPIKVIQGMTSYSTEKGTEEIYKYDFDLVGRALVSRTRDVCDFRKNTLTGYQEIELVKGDGTMVKASIPLIEKYVETGMCEDLKKKYFPPQ